MKKQRLAKFLAHAGIASRRHSEELVFDGLVKVNGSVELLPQTLVCANKDTIEFEGKRVFPKKQSVTYVLNKPKRYLCSNARNSEQDRLVIDLFPDDERLFTVGRLDRDTLGLLLVTTDGALAHKVMHPSSNISKEYLVRTNKEITDVHLKQISNGTYVEGALVKPVSVRKMRRGTLKITVKEGRKHEVRLLVSRTGLPVKELTRIRIGGLVLGNLPVGHYRPLTEREERALFL
jgi:23S rRNA pseudouridine2605 synthase